MTDYSKTASSPEASIKDQEALKELAVITINHQHGEKLKKMLESLMLSIDDLAHQIYVVNNLDDREIKSWLAESYPEIVLVDNEQPKGFAGNINAVIKNHLDYKFFLLINPDVICLPGMVDELLTVMRQDSQIGVAGPMLLNMDGSIQPSRRRFASLPVLIVRALHLDSLFKNLASVDAYFMNDVDFDDLTPVNWLTGAVMLLRKGALDEVGLFDERFYMYFEDEDLCCRMWQKGWKVCYSKTAQAYHEHIAEGRKKILSQANIHHITSAFKMLIKYHGKISRCIDQ